MGIQGMHLSWIVVKDLKKAIEFYTQVIGLSLKEESPDYKWAELSGPSGCTLGIAEESDHSDIKPGSNAIISITVDNLEETCASFVKKGGTVVGKPLEIPGHVKMQTLIDKDNNTMQFVQVLSHEMAKA